MSLRTKNSFYFILKFVFLCCFVNCCEGEFTNDSDEDKLKQALLIVDVLKSEYAKVLRENVTPTPLVELSTCPLTTKNATEAEPSRATSNNESQKNTELTELPVTASVPLYSSTQQEPTPATLPPINFQKNLYSYPGSLRRMPKFMRMPSDYYYYHWPVRRYGMLWNQPPRPTDQEHYRRMPIDELVKASQWNLGLETLASANSQLSSVLEYSKPFRLRGNPYPKKTFKSGFQYDYPFGLASKHGPSDKLTSKSKDQQLKENAVFPEISKGTEDAVLNQIAAELINEFKSEGTSITLNTNNLRTKSTQREKDLISGLDEPKPPKGIRIKTIKHKAKPLPTMKMYLERSTRYALPLPENHAFCFTNPNNALCRTLIK